MQQKNIFILLGGVLVSTLFISGCSLGQPSEYGVNTRPSGVTTPVEIPTNTSSTTSTVGASSEINEQLSGDEQKSWKTYTDSKNGFEFRYHPDLKITNEPEAGPFTYTASLSFPIRWYPGTNLQSALLGVSVTSSCPGLYHENENYELVAPDKIHSAGNLDFVRDYGEEAAAGNYYRTLVYNAVEGGTCYSVFVNLHSTNRMNYDESKRPKEYDPKKFDEALIKTVSTFKLLK